jgi:hypothetical protein
MSRSRRRNTITTTRTIEPGSNGLILFAVGAAAGFFVANWIAANRIGAAGGASTNTATTTAGLAGHRHRRVQGGGTDASGADASLFQGPTGIQYDTTPEFDEGY